MNAKADYRHVVLQDCQTKMFLNRHDFWTSEVEQARDFQTTVNAVTHALTRHISAAQVLVQFEAPHLQNAVVPVSWRHGSS
jgi:hypothetical protein